ncbi:DUF6747 family protein [Sediminicola arcticus]|uniref:DUF6747 family protein n=1 Tax=Sediminicola arcticus TaxID=1574308 RepID=A0ABV2STK3_9FLAO
MKTLLLIRNTYSESFKSIENFFVRNYFKGFAIFSFIMFAVVLYAFIFRVFTGFSFD